MPTRKDILERPFDPALLRTRKGPFGQSITYIAAEDIIRRLSEAGDWSFEIVSHEIRPTEVIVLGKLTMDGIVKMAFGSSAITVSRDGEVISVGDDLKSAATDSCKKASQLLSVGLGLNGEAQTNAARPSNGTGNGNGNGRAAGGNGGNGNGTPHTPDRLTQKQLSAIWAIARRLGLSTEDIRSRCTSAYGVLPEFLSRTDASALIAELQADGEAGAATGAP